MAKSTNNHHGSSEMALALGGGIGVGTCLGAALGLAMGNLVAGMAIGLALGAAIGGVMSASFYEINSQEDKHSPKKSDRQSSDQE